ncbi:b(o/a)3-type cytochrome-c oxidase subunit 1 [Haloferax volcanii]|uniref:B(O/a)3-type cytochrome-c oxidase subunit 1 n=3 Tax=Haloferax volcanii TaxID=2246 RepID=A0A6C0USG5_HALVO|nr:MULTISPECIES: b(o/a)3-type cytochrome-c oxidase subunit 1 [Haloferax]ELZ72693.1 cytochrome c oxidase subunit I [Haloferax lucentense DSM 14919]ELZ92198.1 cytochrome c oxidase subunit I [Haloferax alexandrinus JCM 10717]NLV01869.1 cytochrome C oxidase subunit I [Haloferax alexandrinus]QIB77473.1 b(o/a)3-type cytochrome-c oxidase subunit 1 [Haloferax alexandrinus]TVT95865.1 b(o/a)3-type cytochrome-c oxidase subunit 1 [Haloferax volcanii]
MATASGGGSEFVDKFPDEAAIIKASFLIAFVSLGIGAFFGLIQALHRTNVLRVIDSADYYTVLTGHGVLLAIVFTIFFLCGVFHWAVARSLDRPAESALFSWAWVGLMTTGTVLATVAILGGLVPNLGMSADVLFTFYAPLQAHPIFYIGLAMFIVGTWLAGADWFLSYRAWRQEHPDERIPLQTFMVLTTMIMWYISTLGVAVSVVFFLIPWSLGLIESVNPLLTRTLFWYFGHPIVYFWLMPAYLLWYTVLPKLAGGRLFSDPLARVVFVLFLLLSTPVGIHHQYLDPGIAEGFKFIAMTNTMFLLLPSLLTAFTVVASVEHGARQRGGEGYLRWLGALPWRDPAFTGMALAGAMFAAGGFSGMINAGMNINYLIHNTLWVPGHFHLTVGTAVALTMMAGSYWLVPQVTGRKLYSRPIGLLQVIMWFVGMVFMSNAMHRAGLAGIPRRTAEPQYQNFEFLTPIGSIFELRVQIALGGTLLFLSVVLFLFNILLTSLGEESDRPVDSYLPEPLSGPEGSPRILDNLTMWTGIAAVLVVLAYTLPLAGIIQNGGGLFGGGLPVPATVSAGVDLVMTTVTSAFNTLWGVVA